MSGSLDDRKAKRAPLRSSIACKRCRKSKVKCDNQGPTGPCAGCLKASHECEYPEAVPLPPKRHDAPSAIRGESTGGPERKKAKTKVEEVARSWGDDGTEVAEEVLSANYLSPTIWSQVFDLYRQHYAAELPFLHLPTLKAKLGNKSRAKIAPETNLILLGLLTLTARFHSDIIKYVANSSNRTPRAGSTKSRPPQSGTDATAASDFFEEALDTALGLSGTLFETASVEKVQAFLMLGLYNWMHATPRGLKAWMYFGNAIRMAQALRLSFGDKAARGSTNRHARAHVLTSQAVVDKEIRRRTMFACFILDRMVACGKDRTMAIHSGDMQIQLPCSDHDFDLAVGPETSLLHEPTPGPAKGDSVEACLIRLIHIWGKIIPYTMAGGRLSEKEGVAPWQEASRFRQLRQELCDIYTNLPEVNRFSLDNYHRHDNHHGTSVYVSLHMLGSLCRMMLHREYIPYYALGCSAPVGPLDEPTFPETEYDVPPGFWEANAEEVFRAAKDIVELIEMCGDKLPMASIVCFAVYTAAFCGTYAHYYPHMDQKGYMLTTGSGDYRRDEVDIRTTGPTSLTYQTLVRMSSWLNLTTTFVNSFNYMDQLYYRFEKEYRQNAGKPRFVRGPAGAGKLSVRLGGEGGGLEDWKIHGLKVMNNGSIYAGGDRQEAVEDQSDRASSVEVMETHHQPGTAATARTPRSVVSGSFTAINSTSNRSATQPERHEVPQGHHHIQTMMPAPPVEHGSSSIPTDPNWCGNGNGHHGLPYQGNYHSNQQQQPSHPQQHYQPQFQTQQQQHEQGYTMVEHSPDEQNEQQPGEMDMYHDTTDSWNNFLAIGHRPWHAAPGGLGLLALNTLDGQSHMDATTWFPMTQPVEGYE